MLSIMRNKESHGEDGQIDEEDMDEGGGVSRN
jgi:hypothetical protein